MDVMFFHSGKVAKRVSLILELADRSNFPYPANHSAVQAWMNTRLQSWAGSQEAPPGQSDATIRDAYANLRTGIGETFPAVRLPVLGNVILRNVQRVALPGSVRLCRICIVPRWPSQPPTNEERSGVDR